MTEAVFEVFVVVFCNALAYKENITTLIHLKKSVKGFKFMVDETSAFSSTML